MIKASISTFVVVLLSIQVVCQGVSDSLETQCIEISKILVEEKVFDNDVLKIRFYGANQSYIGNANCFLLGADSYKSFTVEEDTINLWPEKKIFFDRVQTWARLCNCDYDGSRAIYHYEIIQNDSVRIKGMAKLLYKKESWRLSKNRTKKVSPPKHAFDP